MQHLATDTNPMIPLIVSAAQARRMLAAGELVIEPRGGFLSGLLNIGKVLLGVPTAVAPAAVRAVAPIATGVAAGAVGAALVPGAAPGVVTGFPVGAAVQRQTVRKVTLVQSLNAQGLVIATKTLPGAPFLMNKDVVAAKRVFRLSRQLAAKIPKKVVKQSASSALKDAVVDTALRQIACPPKPCP